MSAAAATTYNPQRSPLRNHGSFRFSNIVSRPSSVLLLCRPGTSNESLIAEYTAPTSSIAEMENSSRWRSNERHNAALLAQQEARTSGTPPLLQTSSSREPNLSPASLKKETLAPLKIPGYEKEEELDDALRPSYASNQELANSSDTLRVDMTSTSTSSSHPAFESTASLSARASASRKSLERAASASCNYDQMLSNQEDGVAMLAARGTLDVVNQVVQDFEDGRFSKVDEKGAKTPVNELNLPHQQRRSSLNESGVNSENDVGDSTPSASVSAKHGGLGLIKAEDERREEGEHLTSTAAASDISRTPSQSTTCTTASSNIGSLDTVASSLLSAQQLNSKESKNDTGTTLNHPTGSPALGGSAVLEQYDNRRDMALLRRYHALMELISTERTYAEDLNTLVDVFFDNLTTQIFFDEDQSRVDTVIRNAKELAGLHTKLSRQLSRIVEDCALTPDDPGSDLEKAVGRSEAAIARIARRLQRMATHFSAYQYFCARHAEALVLIREAEKRHGGEDFASFERLCGNLMRSQAKASHASSKTASGTATPVTFSRASANLSNSTSSTDPESPTSGPSTLSTHFAQYSRQTTARLHFADYLIKPIQRLCLYPLVLSSLLKYTAEDEFATRHALEAAIASMKKVADEVDEASKQRQKDLTTELLICRIEPQQTISQSYLRSLGNPILSGTVDVLYHHGILRPLSNPLRFEHRGIILWKGWLLIVKVRKTQQLECRYWFPLKDARLSSGEVEIEGAPHSTAPLSAWSWPSSSSTSTLVASISSPSSPQLSSSPSQATWQQPRPSDFSKRPIVSNALRLTCVRGHHFEFSFNTAMEKQLWYEALSSALADAPTEPPVSMRSFPSSLGDQTPALGEARVTIARRGQDKVRGLSNDDQLSPKGIMVEEGDPWQNDIIAANSALFSFFATHSGSSTPTDTLVKFAGLSSRIITDRNMIYSESVIMACQHSSGATTPAMSSMPAGLVDGHDKFSRDVSEKIITQQLRQAATPSIGAAVGAAMGIARMAASAGMENVKKARRQSSSLILMTDINAPTTPSQRSPTPREALVDGAAPTSPGKRASDPLATSSWRNSVLRRSVSKARPLSTFGSISPKKRPQRSLPTSPLSSTPDLLRIDIPPNAQLSAESVESSPRRQGRPASPRTRSSVLRGAFQHASTSLSNGYCSRRARSHSTNPSLIVPAPRSPPSWTTASPPSDMPNSSLHSDFGTMPASNPWNIRRRPRPRSSSLHMLMMPASVEAQDKNVRGGDSDTSSVRTFLSAESSWHSSTDGVRRSHDLSAREPGWRSTLRRARTSVALSWPKKDDSVDTQRNNSSTTDTVEHIRNPNEKKAEKGLQSKRHLERSATDGQLQCMGSIPEASSRRGSLPEVIGSEATPQAPALRKTPSLTRHLSARFLQQVKLTTTTAPAFSHFRKESREAATTPVTSGTTVESVAGSGLNPVQETSNEYSVPDRCSEDDSDSNRTTGGQGDLKESWHQLPRPPLLRPPSIAEA